MADAFSYFDGAGKLLDLPRVAVVNADGSPVGGGSPTGTPYTLLTNAAATGSAVTIAKGTYTASFYGTWGGATAQLQRTPNGSTWIDVDGVLATANGGVFNLPLPAGQVRVAITGATGSTSISVVLESN
jgi:hypothetical protein